MADILERERRGRVEVLRLNRPEARNAMSPELSAAIEGALDDIEPDPETAVVVVAGNGPVFCAGADLRVIAAGAEHGPVARDDDDGHVAVVLDSVEGGLDPGR